ncbi:hypothetical protein BDC45DRAFT_539834 [Circinella umbellata]|nr:hypothetical protein BDC45DRAFT_539834 [Circinella umbellata]
MSDDAYFYVLDHQGKTNGDIIKVGIIQNYSQLSLISRELLRTPHSIYNFSKLFAPSISSFAPSEEFFLHYIKKLLRCLGNKFALVALRQCFAFLFLRRYLTFYYTDKLFIKTIKSTMDN